MSAPVYFNVVGLPRPKQSFQYSSRGGGFTPARVKDWQNLVSAEAGRAMIDRDKLAGPITAEIDFYLPNRSRRDLDNLSKGVLDAMNGLVYDDDCQVIDLHLRKFFDSEEYGCTVTVKEAGNG